MKQNKKNLVLGLAVIACLLIVFLASVLFKKESVESYRSIKVQENMGVTEVTRMEETLTAYDGMKLEQKDDVYVTKDSNMIMQLDDDKYVFAEENTKFHLEVSGKKDNGKVKICLNEGSVLVEIQNKLSEEDFFEIETPNATMAVRGTVFYVEAAKNEAGEVVTKVSVFEGKVETVGEGKESVLLPPGLSITLTGDVNPVEQQEEIQLEELSVNVLSYLSEMDEKEGACFKKEEILEVLEKREPSLEPTKTPTVTPSPESTKAPTSEPTVTPSPEPTKAPTSTPTATPSLEPTSTPTVTPSPEPTKVPTSTPTATPIQEATKAPTVTPSPEPTSTPTVTPSPEPTKAPTSTPTATPSLEPTSTPTVTPSPEPTKVPTSTPTATPIQEATKAPTVTATLEPTIGLEWEGTVLNVSGTGVMTDEVFQQIVYEVFLNNGGTAFDIVIEEGISEINLTPLDDKNLISIALAYGMTIDELVYQVFSIMNSITLPESVNVIEIEGMPTAEEIDLYVIVKSGSYAEDWANEKGFMVIYY